MTRCVACWLSVRVLFIVYSKTRGDSRDGKWILSPVLSAHSIDNFPILGKRALALAAVLERHVCRRSITQAYLRLQAWRCFFVLFSTASAPPHSSFTCPKPSLRASYQIIHDSSYRKHKRNQIHLKINSSFTLAVHSIDANLCWPINSFPFSVWVYFWWLELEKTLLTLFGQICSF